MANGPEPDTHCLVCGYHLAQPAWAGDQPSWETCPACGITFGVDDGGADAANRAVTHRRWRRRWVAEGMPWASPTVSAPSQHSLITNLRTVERFSEWDRKHLVDTARAFLDGRLDMRRAAPILYHYVRDAEEADLVSADLEGTFLAVEDQIDDLGFGRGLLWPELRDHERQLARALHHDLEDACRRLLAELAEQ